MIAIYSSAVARQVIKQIYKHNHPITASQVDNIVDLGYPDIEKDFPTVNLVHPIKKKKNTLLSNDDMRYNKNHPRLRINSGTHHMQDQEVWNNVY